MKAAQNEKLPILTYHSIDESHSIISTGKETFRSQMKFLSENAFNIVSMKTAAKFILQNRELPAKTIVLTFDDGFENFYTGAFPVLNEYNFTATVFLITDYCGKFNDWAGNLPLLRHSKLMDWSKIKELSAYNVEFASHSRTHPDLTKIPLINAEREIIESKNIIEEKLGNEVINFAYPYGAYNFEVKGLTAKYYQTSCSTAPGKARLRDDPFSLNRIDAYYLRNERIFRSLSAARFDLYMSLRRIMRDLKSSWYSR